MRKILPNSPKTKKYFKKLHKIYIVVYWAECIVIEAIYSGKTDKFGAPLVWDYYYYDSNSNDACDEWRLCEIYSTTHGRIFCWTDVKENAYYIANALNKQTGYNYDRKIDL